MSHQPKGARLAPFGFGLALFALLPNEIGYQDIASLLARQPGVAERWQKRVFASSAAAVQVATFSFARPIGTAAQETINHRLASLGGQNLDSEGVEITGSIQRGPIAGAPRRYQASDFPTVDRTLKGDRLLASPVTDDQPTADSFKTNRSVMGAKTAQMPPNTAPLDADLAAALKAPPLTASGAADVSLSLETNPVNDSKRAVAGVALGTMPAAPRDSFGIGTASLFFGNAAIGETAGLLERWEPGEEPTIVADPDLKVASLPNVTEQTGQSVAGKG